MLDFHEGVTLDRPMNALCSCADFIGMDAIYCLDAPEAMPSGSTRRVDVPQTPPFATPSRSWRA